MWLIDPIRVRRIVFITDSFRSHLITLMRIAVRLLPLLPSENYSAAASAAASSPTAAAASTGGAATAVTASRPLR